jgi:hypothetical protein
VITSQLAGCFHFQLSAQEGGVGVPWELLGWKERQKGSVLRAYQQQGGCLLI